MTDKEIIRKYDEAILDLHGDLMRDRLNKAQEKAIRENLELFTAGRNALRTQYDSAKSALPSRYRAKSDDSDQWFEGYYVEYPETTYCFAEDGKPPVKHCLVFHQMTDWGLPNRLMIATIDPDTLEPLEEGGTKRESEKM